MAEPKSMPTCTVSCGALGASARSSRLTTDMTLIIAKPKPAAAAARSCGSGRRVGSGRPAATKYCSLAVLRTFCSWKTSARRSNRSNMDCSSLMTRGGSAVASFSSADSPSTLAKRNAHSLKLSANCARCGRAGRSKPARLAEGCTVPNSPLLMRSTRSARSGRSPPPPPPELQLASARPVAAYQSALVEAVPVLLPWCDADGPLPTPWLPGPCSRSSEPRDRTRCGGRIDLSSRSQVAVSSSMQRINALCRASRTRWRHMPRAWWKWCSTPTVCAAQSMATQRSSSYPTAASRLVASAPLPPSSSPQKASTRFTLIPTNAADPTSIHTQVCEETLFTAGHRHGRHRAGKGRERH
mmetsp:Transcript_20240/g.65057  ORF Transcript_20240/g.65057 Transcript_20240/m.65057 type:complete len:355 (+) Transcript_20240:589-1653(+)